MKNYQFLFSLKKERIGNLFLFLAFMGILNTIPVCSRAQVVFTQTTDADFSAGYLDNVVVASNNVYLAYKATEINNWITANDLPQTLTGHKVTRWKNYVYLSGGFNGTNFSDMVYRATMQTTGNSTWTIYDSIPDSLADHAMVASNEYMYILGGRKGGAPVDKIYYTKINSDGTLGDWTESSVTLPQPLWGHTAIFLNGFIYVVGGTSSTVENTANNAVYFTKIAGINGDISAFTATNSLPEARNKHSMVCYDNHLIVMGGYDNTGTKYNTVYYSDLNLNGTCSAWSSAAALPVDISNHSSTCNNGWITVIGGEDTGGLSDKIYYADIDNLSSLIWVTAADMLNLARKDGAAYTSNGQIVFAGGENISGEPIHNTRYTAVDLVLDGVHKGSFLSYPFYQLGEEREIVSLTYDIYSNMYNEYNLIYRLAGADQQWGSWIEAGQDNPVIVGLYKQYIQYLIKFDGTGDDNIVLHDLSVNISGYTQLTGSLNAIDTLKYADSPFWATTDISFTGGTHVIEAGVEIFFSTNTGLEIGQANMTFEGTALDPILMTSFTSEAGVWNGVYFNTNSDNGVSSQLDYVTIEKAGYGTRDANFYCENTNEPLLQNCLFTLSDGQGVRLNNADLSIDLCNFEFNTENGLYLQNSNPSVSNCSLSNNGIAGIRFADLGSSPNYFNCDISNNKYGIYYFSPNYSFPTVSGIATYNNTISGIAMDGGIISSNQTWPFNSLGYAVLGDVTIAKINSHSRLTIMPGNTIYFDTTIQLQVGNYIYYNQNYGGELFAIGTADSLITFTSINGQSGGWDGIYFHNDSDSFESISELKNCSIQNGNSYNIRCVTTLQPRIDSCIITNSMNHDIYVQDPNSVPHITASTSTVYVDGGTQSINKTWYNFGGGDYVILNDIIVAKQNTNSTLTIEPGITVKLDTSVIFQVGDQTSYNQFLGGEIIAEGTADSLITFTSRNGLVGGWDGIYFHPYSDNFGAASSMKYCTVEKGKDYNIKSNGSTEPRIDLCTITNSDGYDIYAVAPNDVQHITNTVSTVYVGTGVQSINKTWYNFGGEYIVVGDIIIAKQNTNSTLTIEPGNTVKLDTSVFIQIGQHYSYNNFRGGEIIAEGTADSLITFTSLNGLVGGWDGIYFHDYSDNYGASSSIKYCTIEKGKDYNIKSNISTEPRIDLCTITNSDGYDIYATTPNDVQHITNTVSTVYVGTGVQSVNKTWYNFGGEYIVVGDIIVAKQNTNSTLTIEPGNTVKLDTSVFIQIGQHYSYNNFRGGEIIAEGTADSLITFTSLNGLVGGWDGIYFHDYSDNYGASSSMKYCTIEKGKDYNIKSNISTEPRIDSCTITNSDGYDIYATAPNDVQHITNTVSTVYVGAGVQSINRTWYNFGGEYIVVGDIIVAKQNSYSTLTIEPGITVKLDSSVIIQVGEHYSYNNFRGGEIIAEGTHDSLITFTSLNPITDRWDGFYFHPYADNYGSNSSLKYCIIDDATTNDMYCDGTNMLDLEHVTFINSGESGMRLNNSSPYLKLCQFINNDSIGVLLTGTSNPVIGDTLGFGCDIYGNGDFGIYNETANLIHAKNNFWNTTDSLTIAGQVYDHYDNGPYGIVEFMPVAANSFFDNLPPEGFSLISLPDNIVTTDQTPSFTWEVPIDPDGDAISYYFYYTDDITWSSNITVSGELTDPSYTIPETLTGGKWYGWKVKATDGYLSKFSNQAWTFAVSLPPIVPSPIVPSNGTLMREDDYLVWLTTTDPDVGDYVSHYHLQIDDDPGFSSLEVDTNGIQVDTKASSISMQINSLPGYLDLENRNYYWRVSATDGFGIESDFSDGSNYFLYMMEHTIKVYLDGPFNGYEMETTLNEKGLVPLEQPYNLPPWNYMEYESVTLLPVDAVDWLLLEIRNGVGNPSTASNVLYRKAVLLLKDGIVIDVNGSALFEFPVSFDDNTYLTIYHRNHLGIISGDNLIPTEGSYDNDFSSGSDKVWGGISGYSEISPGIWGMSGGDANTDGSIDLNDKNIDWKEDAGNTNYLNTDFNLDGQVNNPDKDDQWLKNTGKISQVPE